MMRVPVKHLAVAVNDKYGRFKGFLVAKNLDVLKVKISNLDNGCKRTGMVFSCGITKG